jgi:hypothetical protein
MTLLNGLSEIYTNGDTKNSGHRVICTSSRPHTPSLFQYMQVMFPNCTNQIHYYSSTVDVICTVIQGVHTVYGTTVHRTTYSTVHAVERKSTLYIQYEVFYVSRILHTFFIVQDQCRKCWSGCAIFHFFVHRSLYNVLYCSSSTICCYSVRAGCNLEILQVEKVHSGRTRHSEHQNQQIIK